MSPLCPNGMRARMGIGPSNKKYKSEAYNNLYNIADELMDKHDKAFKELAK